MAAAVITYRTILDEIKLALNDPDNQFMSEAEYTGFVLKHITNDVSTYTFQKRGNYFWTWTVGGRRAYFHGPSFSGEDDCEYTWYPNGTINCGTGTPTATTIEVTATPINFPEVICEICEYLLLHRCKEPSQSLGSASYTPPDEERIRRVMETWRGVVRL